MHSEDTKRNEFSQYWQSDEAPFIICADLQCLIEKTDGCRSNRENSSAIKAGEHIWSDFSMSKILSFQSKANKLDVNRGKDYMKKFCESLREQAMEIINFKKKKMKLRTNEQQKSFENARQIWK